MRSGGQGEKATDSKGYRWAQREQLELKYLEKLRQEAVGFELFCLIMHHAHLYLRGASGEEMATVELSTWKSRGNIKILIHS